EDKVINLIDKPLSFSRVWDGSLTSGEMSRGYFAYSRLLYRWTFRQWHWNLRNEGRKAILPEKAPRPYAVPTTFEAGRRNEHLGHFVLFFFSYFSRQAKFADSVLEDLLALPGLRLAICTCSLRKQNDRRGLFRAYLKHNASGTLRRYHMTILRLPICLWFMMHQ